ncbi:hypothetical protein DFQ28_001129 [Apophysomyces sp. BC1034]|nr:hypothetical protein DFQ29_000529 [Apophysomyces sp. BC1021]KAG0191005.1 hypothetical protein DFQ28_001129 [Apophysomyces sp. BC1034]
MRERLKQILLNMKKKNPQKKSLSQATAIPWSWVAVTMAQLFNEYPTGLTETIVLGELQLQWEQVAVKRFKRFGGSDDSSYRVLDMYMHPKFNQWMESKRPSLRSQPDFLKDRCMRMVCGSSINTVVISQYNNEDLPRESRIAKIAPTQLLMFMLTSRDSEFIRKEFTDNFSTLIAPGLFDINKRKEHKLWLKVIHVENTTHNSPEASVHTSVDTDERMKLQRMDIYVVDMVNDSDPAMLSLYDEQTELASMICRGDYIGLYNPGILANLTESQEQQSDIVFEYDNDTVLFIMSEKEAQEADVARTGITSASVSASLNPPRSPGTEFWQEPTKNKCIVERDEEERKLIDGQGYMDCSTYLDRIFIRDLDSCMLNVTIMGRVVAIASNNPFNKPGGRRMDRYAMRLADPTGKVDITLWEETGNCARHLQPGQHVLLIGLTTSATHITAKGPVCRIELRRAAADNRYSIVSSMKSLLTSSSFRHITPIKQMTDGAHYQVEAMIVGWEFHTRKDPSAVQLSNCHRGVVKCQLGHSIIVDAHASCLRPINGVYQESYGGVREDGKIEQEDTNEKGMRVCEFCGRSIAENDVVQVYRSRLTASERFGWQGWIEWELDDGSGVTVMTCGGEETVLNIPAQRFRGMSYEAQVDFLDSAVEI